MTKANSRIADHEIDPLFLNRWSPRAFTGETIPDDLLLTFFEAARWAPSTFNSQPWRFLYAKHGEPDFAKFLDLLMDANKVWAKDASVLMIVVSKKTFPYPGRPEPMPSLTHSFDTGSAWASFAFQAVMSGWYTHGMAGFDYERARVELNVPDDCKVEAAIAVGRFGDPASLPESLRSREAPNSRIPVTEFVIKGGFPPQ